MERFGEIGGLSRFACSSQQTEFYEGVSDDLAQFGSLFLRRQVILLIIFDLCHVASTRSSFSQK